MTGVLLFGRTRLSRSTGLALLAALLVTTGLQGRTFLAPVIPWDVTVLTSPLLPVLVAVVALKACEPTLVGLELAAPRARVARVRLGWATAVLVVLSVACGCSAAVANALALGVRTAPSVLACAFASFFAAGLVGAVVFGADLGWLLPCLLVTALVFFGRNSDQVPFSWAWLLHAPGSVSLWLVTALLVLAALAGYCWSDTTGRLRS